MLELAGRLKNLLVILSLRVVLWGTVLLLCLRVGWRLFPFGLSSCLLLTLFSYWPMLYICIADVEPRLNWYNTSISVINRSLVFLMLRFHVLILRLLLVVLHFFIFLMVEVSMTTTFRMLLLPAGYKTNKSGVIIIPNDKSEISSRSPPKL